MNKVYDQTYFDHWYRDGGDIASPAHLRRKVSMAVATAEYYLERPLRSALDIGAGEAAWRAPLLKLRPRLNYLAFDTSEYAVLRFGARRNLHRAQFGDFAYLRPCAPADLMICSDVLHYLSAAELKAGLQGVADLTGGIAFLETFTKGDSIGGDIAGFQPRTAAFYVKAMAAVGLRPLGSHFWVREDVYEHLAGLERPFK